MISLQALRLRNDNVLVRLESPKTEGLIVAPQNRKLSAAEPIWGVVEAVGPGWYHDRRVSPTRPREPSDCSPHVSGACLISMTVALGDRVLLESSLSGERILEDGIEYRLVRESEIMLVDDGARQA